MVIVAGPYVRMVKNRTLKVKGVTYDNDDGTSRQEILEDIKRRRPPFDEDLCLRLEEYDYEGRPAYYVKVNGSIIGVIPSYLSPFVTENRDNIIGLRDLEVSSFRDRDTGKTIYYAEATLAVSMDECGCESDVFDDDYEDDDYAPEYRPHFHSQTMNRQGASDTLTSEEKEKIARLRRPALVLSIVFIVLLCILAFTDVPGWVFLINFGLAIAAITFAMWAFKLARDLREEKSAQQAPPKSAKEKQVDEAINSRWFFAVLGVGLMVIAVLGSVAHMPVFLSVFLFLYSLFSLAYALYGFFKYWDRKEQEEEE